MYNGYVHTVKPINNRTKEKNCWGLSENKGSPQLDTSKGIMMINQGYPIFRQPHMWPSTILTPIDSMEKILTILALKIEPPMFKIRCEKSTMFETGCCPTTTMLGGESKSFVGRIPCLLVKAPRCRLAFSLFGQIVRWFPWTHPFLHGRPNVDG